MCSWDPEDGLLRELSECRAFETVRKQAQEEEHDLSSHAIEGATFASEQVEEI